MIRWCFRVCMYVNTVPLTGLRTLPITSACLYEQNWSFFYYLPPAAVYEDKMAVLPSLFLSKKSGHPALSHAEKTCHQSKQPSPIHPIRTTHITMTDIDGYLQIRDNRTKHFLVDTTTTTTTTTTSNLLQFQLRNLLSAHQRLIS